MCYVSLNLLQFLIKFYLLKDESFAVGINSIDASQSWCTSKLIALSVYSFEWSIGALD